ncbi:MAG: hypothetical protein QF913_07845 [Nitrospinaceae bacterium]|jgi:hypothetical protein|nr:hypothetical protein [Nitrospinaceae bacterium]
MSKLANAPKEVLKVHNLLVKNATEAFGDKKFGKDAVFTRADEDGSWIVGPNFENYGNSMIYKPEGWFYRESWSGADKAMRGGYEEAKGNAQCFFTG